MYLYVACEVLLLPPVGFQSRSQCQLCSFIMEYDVHTILDLLTLAATGWIIFMILTKLKSTWQQDKDVMLEAYVVRSMLWCFHTHTAPITSFSRFARLLCRNSSAILHSVYVFVCSSCVGPSQH